MLSAVLVALVACGPGGRAPAPQVVDYSRASEVLVIWNANAPESRIIQETYVEKRHIPKDNVLALRVTTNDNIPAADYNETLLPAVREWITKKKLKINFLVLIRGVPLRINNDGGYSLDATLMVDAHPTHAAKFFEPPPYPEVKNGQLVFDEQGFRRALSPYCGKDEPFDSSKYGFYLATRLDGYTVEDAIGLIQRSFKAKPEKGVFLLDASPGKTDGGYGTVQGPLVATKPLLEKKGLQAVLDEKEQFVGFRKDLMGYASWGSNDESFKSEIYNSLGFLPGAIAETFVSTSARTFRPTSGGQSLIADLVRQGVTGVKGYASEPFTFGLCRVNILFDRYTSGFNLAESFYMASPLLKWKDIVIGDPLCAPYKK